MRLKARSVFLLHSLPQHLIGYAVGVGARSRVFSPGEALFIPMNATSSDVLPNQALEPTSTSVTIPAGAGLAPAVDVAHL